MSLLRMYKREISRYPRLSNEEMLDLFKKYAAGDQEAKNKIYTSNLPLVIKIASHYPRKSEDDLLDIIQEGNFGLDLAITKFDPKKYSTFSTFATPPIKWRIRNYLHKRSLEDKRKEKISRDRREKTPEEQAIISQRKEKISQILKRLSLEERILIEANYGLNHNNMDEYSPPLTEDECKDIFNLKTGQAVALRKRFIMKKLRFYLSSCLL